MNWALATSDLFASILSCFSRSCKFRAACTFSVAAKRVQCLDEAETVRSQRHEGLFLGFAVPLGQGCRDLASPSEDAVEVDRAMTLVK